MNYKYNINRLDKGFSNSLSKSPVLLPRQCPFETLILSVYLFEKPDKLFGSCNLFGKQHLLLRNGLFTELPSEQTSWNQRMLRKSRVMRMLGHFSVSPETVLLWMYCQEPALSVGQEFLARVCLEGVWTSWADTSGQTRSCLSYLLQAAADDSLSQPRGSFLHMLETSVSFSGEDSN